MKILDDILIEEELLSAKFSCDLSKCKGACCTMEGDVGAPLLDDEILYMTKNFKVASKYLDSRAKEYIKENGFYTGEPNDRSTVVINNRDCVFVYYDNGVAKCAYEKAYFLGESEFRKPISCHLYPIRIANYGGTYLYYSVIDECESARKKGEKDNINLFYTVKDALIRRFGEDWTYSLESYILNNNCEDENS